MESKNIGIDIDGVLFNVVDRCIEVAQINYGLSLTTSQITEHDLSKCTPLSPAQLKTMFDDPGFYTGMAPMPFARSLTYWLRCEGYTIHLVTARPAHLDGSTIHSLLKHKFVYDHLVFEPDKVAYSLANDLGYFIEDRHKTAMALAEAGVWTFLVDWPYNQRPSHWLVIRVDSLASVATRLRNFSQTLASQTL